MQLDRNEIYPAVFVVGLVLLYLLCLKGIITGLVVLIFAGGVAWLITTTGTSLLNAALYGTGCLIVLAVTRLCFKSIKKCMCPRKNALLG